MASFIHRLFSSITSIFPWPSNNVFRDYLQENEENNYLGIAPPKRQKLYKGPFVPKVLSEINIQPTVTTVRPSIAKLQIGEDLFQPALLKSSMPWAEKSHLNNDGRTTNHVSPNSKSRKRLSSVSLSIDLTKEDDSVQEIESSKVPVVDLTRSPHRRPIQIARRSLSNPKARSTPVVDLTGQESRSPSPENKPIRSSLPGSGSRMRGNTAGAKSHLTRDRHNSFRSFSGNPPEDMLRSKPFNSIDLTNSSNSTQMRRSASFSVSENSMIDLKECINYGRVLGSMVKAKAKSQPKLAPPVFGGTIDLTGDEEDQSEGKKDAAPTSRATPNMRSPVVEKSQEPSAAISSSTQKGLKKEITKVNSFQKKISEIPCTQDTWITKLLKEYEDKQKEFNAMKDSFAREAIKWSEVNHKDIETFLDEKINRHLRITEAAIPEPPKEPCPSIIVPLPKLTKEMEAKVASAFHRKRENDQLIQKFNLCITRNDIQTLKNLNWLNDEVINFYMQLLEQRCEQKENYPSVHTFSTFFYIGLQTRGHEGMKRWTKKVNIFEKDIIIVPIHIHVHWCLLVVDLKKKEINYYDSMGNDNDDCLAHMSKYLKAEYKAKEEGELDLSDWKISNVKDIPQQMNGSDCGVFACTYAEFSSRRAPFTFDQSLMQYFRTKMAYEILTGELLQ